MRLRFGVAWYEPGDWRAVREAAIDPDDFESSYDEWLRLSKTTCAELAADGIEVERVRVNADELIGWCREQRIPLDVRARTRFAMQKR
jgi:hypothetical protein